MNHSTPLDRRTAAIVRRWRAVMLRLNAPLLIGGLLVALLVGGALLAPLLAPHDPLEPILRMVGGQIAPAPYPPGTPGMPLGSDRLGRDMLSRLIYGSRYTLLICAVAALARLVIGAVLGMLAAWYSRTSRAIDVLIGASSAIPSLFFAMVPIAVVNRSRDIDTSLAIFMVALSLTGWAETAVRCRTAVHGLRAAPFIDSAYAIGLRRGAILYRHVLPNLRDVLLIEGAYALAATLLLLAELAFLNIVLGGGEPALIGDRMLASDPIFAEWGSMLARGLRQRAYLWLFLEPLVAFTLAILGFNLLAEGLRRRR
ncbi:MAG TPA: ABC transporter permease [Herpetosiphonaceae bacterium]